MKAYLTVPETAEYLNVSERFVRRVIAQRRIPFHYVGRHIRPRSTDVGGFWDAREAKLLVSGSRPSGNREIA